MKKINICYWWVFWFIFLETIYRVFIINSFFSVDTLLVVIFSIFNAFLINLLCSFFKQDINKKLTIVLSCIITILFLAQEVYYNFYGSIFSFYSLTKGTAQVMQFWIMILRIIINIWYIFILTLIPFILFIKFSNKFYYNRITKFNILSSISSFILIVILIINSSGVYSLSNLIFNIHSPLLTVKKTGLYSMQIIDLYRYLTNFEEKSDLIVSNDKVYTSNEYNVYNIDFNSIIDEEDNETIKNIHSYINSLTPSNKNEYTGKFKDKNLILITAESFDISGISKELTPTLYNMLNNSISFTNYYQPLYPVSTADGEYMNLFSLIPKEGQWSFSESTKNYYPYSIGNMFKNNGYTTYAYHNNSYTYYNRNEVYPNIGLKYKACGNGLESLIDCDSFPSSDNEMISNTINEYITNEKFFTYYMTVSSHLNYDFKTNNISVKNKSEVSSLNYSNSVKAYLATLIELDKALDNLLSTLKENNKLDDTLIIIAPDHYPYGLLDSELNEISDKDRSDKFEKYHTTLIMYNSNLEKKVVDKYICGLDLLPTIYNLFGIEYDSRMFMGSDIFSDSDGLVILSDRSFITNKGTFNSLTGKFNSFNDEVSEEYIENINKIVNNKFIYSGLIFKYDYYRVLYDKNKSK